MRANGAAAWVFAILLTVWACGGGGFSEAIEVNQEFVDAMETYLDGIEKAENGSDVADTINAYADKIETLAPRMKAVAQKYPEWKDEAKIPEELKPLNEKARNLAQRMAGTFMKAMQYMQDPAVQEAQQRLAKSMGMMQ